MQKQNKAKFRSFTKRLQCIVCATFMLLTTLLTEPLKPLEAKAEIEGILRIAGVIVTEENASDILGNGVFSYDAVQKKLKINGDFNYDDSHYDLIGNHSIDGLKIYVASDSNLTMIPGSGAFYINADTTITGPGVLTLEQRYVPIEIAHGNLMIKDAKVNLISTTGGQGSCGINLENDSKLELINSDLTITCSDESQRGAIYGYKSKLAIEDCEIVTPEGGEIKDVFIDEDSSYQTIVDADGKPANIVKTTSIPRVVDYAVIPNSKTIKKDCYDDPDYLAGNKTLKFSAARNERESGQIILKSDVDINNITIEKSDLVGPDGNTISQDNVEIFFERYIEEKNESHEYVTDTQGYYGDALLPYNLAVELNNNNLSVENGKNQGIWFTLNIPTDQNEGTYTGNYKIRYNEGYITVPVEVNVYNFTLPDQTYSRTRFNVFSSGIEDVLINMAGFDKDKSNDYKLAVNDLLNARKMTTGRANTSIPWRLSKFDDHGNPGSLNNLNDYAERVYKYVTTSKAPYYGLDFSVYSEGRTTIFDDNIDISGEYIDALNNTTVLDELINNGESQTLSTIISNKKDDIIKSLAELYRNPLSYDENEAVGFAVDVYLYFDLKYYTGSLTADDMNFINPDLVNRYNENIRGDLERIRNLNAEKRTEELEALKTKIKEKKINVYRLYDGLIISESYLKNGSNAGRNLARKLNSFSNLSQYDFIGTGEDSERVFFGTQSVMKSLVDKSFEKKTDLLKYAFYRCDIDEPAPYDYWRNYKIIVCNKVMDDTKKAIIEYIETNYKKDPMSAEVINSVANIAFISTMTAIDNNTCTFKSNTFLMNDVNNYSSMVYKGIGVFFNEQINQEMPMKVYKDGFVKTVIDNNGTEKKVGRGKNESEDYTIEVPTNYTVKSYCPLFNDFSTHTDGSHFAKDLEATQEALKDPNIHMWWYSCSSSGHPSLAGHFLGGNINTDKDNLKLNMNGNSLAIDRANQWQQFKLGIEGELYWAVDDYGDDDDKYDYNVWENTNGSCNEGILIYPIYQYLTASLGMSSESAKGKCNEYGYFASSVRLENLSEGKDDYDYLFLANKLIKEAELIGEDVTPYIERINRRYDSLFSSANYTESTTSEKISYAKQTLAEIITSLQYITRTKGIVFDIESGGKSDMVIRFDKEDDQHHYSDPIYLDLENETATVGTLVKYANEDKYEYIAFLDDLPMTAEPLNDSDDHHLCLKEITGYSFNGDGSITENVTSHTNIKFSSVDLVKPIKQFSYEKSTFWNTTLDEEFSNWKNSDTKLVLHIKAVDITDEKNNENHTASIYFTPASSSEVLTKMFAIDFSDPKNPTTEIGMLEPMDCGWFTLTIPLKELTTQKADSINKPIGKIAARYIDHSFAIKVVDSTTSEPPTGIKPVNRTIWGDANCDSVVELSDAILIMQSIANPNKYGINGTSPSAITEKGKELADVDTTVKGLTGNDALKIQKYLLKIISSLNPNE